MSEKAEKVKVKFTREYTVRDEEARTYKVDEVVELPPASANHFIVRGAAELVDDAKKPKGDDAKK